MKKICTLLFLVFSTFGFAQTIITVKTATELQNALNAATAGQTIYIADGLYTKSGGFVVPAGIHGTQANPIILMGSKNAILTCNNTSSGYGIGFQGNDYWIIDGFSIKNSSKGIVLDNCNHTIVQNLYVSKIGYEGIHLRTYSSFNTVQNCFIDTTGLISPGTAEGIYVGSSVNNWPTYTAGNPDTCNYNSIISNSFGNFIGSENIDIKEGTKGGLIAYNSFNGAGLNGVNSGDSWVDVKGNNYKIKCNTGINTSLDGVQSHILVAGYGDYNSFENNNFTVNATGYGISIQTSSGSLGATAPNNSVCSNNTSVGAAKGVTNISTSACSGTCPKISQSILFNALISKTVGDPNFYLTAVSTSGLPISYTSSNTAVATVNGNIVTIVGGGSTTITASQAGNTNYSSATNVSQTLTVNASGKLNQTITFSTLPAKTVGDASFNITATASSGLAVSYKSSNTAVATISGNTVTIVGAGSATITASQPGNANYNAAANVTQTLTVAKANQTITFSTLPAKTVGDASFNLTATASSGLTVTYASSNTAVATISGNTVTIVGAGSATITASQPGNTNYNASTNVTQTLTVAKANQTITFSTLPAKTVSDASFNLTATASSGLAVSYTSSNTAVATISGSTVTIVGAGSATITASQPGNANYNAAANVTQTLTVAKANQTITFSTLPAKTVGDASFNLTATASSGLTVSYTSSNTAVATISGNTVTIVGAGSATITSSQSGNANYNAAADVTQELTVNNVITTGTLPTLTSTTVNLFPNPATNTINLILNNSVDQVSLLIYSIDGKNVYSKTTDAISGTTINFDLHELTTGTYFMEIHSNGEVIVKRFIKQ